MSIHSVSNVLVYIFLPSSKTRGKISLAKSSPRFTYSKISFRITAIPTQNDIFMEGFSKKEDTRLRYIQWQLDRIDDAEHGESIDSLQKMAEDHDRFANEVEKLVGELTAAQSGSKARKKYKPSRK